jgi:hypothetical protein
MTESAGESQGGVAWMREHWEALEREHNFEWVVADSDGLIAHDPDLTVVLEQLVGTDPWRAAQAVIALVDADEEEGVDQELEPEYPR